MNTESQYTVTLTIDVTASYPKEAIRFFLNDANDTSLDLSYNVTDPEGDTFAYNYTHDDEAE